MGDTYAGFLEPGLHVGFRVADASAWEPAQLTSTLRDYFAGRDPEQNFAASSVMGE